MTGTLVRLDDPDQYALEKLCDHLGCTRTQVMRWALRYYALHGPWGSEAPLAIDALYSEARYIDVGPALREVR